MKVIIPMAGNGSRFADQGYPLPKPFIDVGGKPMIKRVVESLLLYEHEHIFLCRAEHLVKYNLSALFPYIKHKILPIYGTTEGAAITVSMVKDLVHESEDILIINSDQLFHYDSNEVDVIRNSDVDGCLWCFTGSGPKWSYVRLDENERVIEVAEKRQISNIATGGMYYWRSFGYYIECLNRMILANDRTNNEFYVAPTYNYINPGDQIVIKMLDDIDQLGTPEDLQAYANKVRLY